MPEAMAQGMQMGAATMHSDKTAPISERSPRQMFSDACFNEMYRPDGSVREHYLPLAEWLTSTPKERIHQMREAAQMLFHRVGITFAVYGDDSGAERLIPFDILPHVIPMSEWRE